jgi:transcriptional regulator GlxA family with amidase domain
MRRRIGFVIHPGFQFLDVVGPTAAFEMATRYGSDGYDLVIQGPTAGPVQSSSGLSLTAASLNADGLDTIIVAGGQLDWDKEAFGAIVRWLGDVRPRRLASVCSGAFMLAAAGRLDGRAATTHWDSTERFRTSFPRVKLDPDRIYTRDGDVWTSAGISAGIDMALAMIEEDLGAAVARRTAQQLVVYSRRPGGQSQFSGLIELGGETGRFQTLVAGVKEKMHQPLTIEQMADRAAMSPRNFSRAFVREVGCTPAKAVEQLRLEAARDAVEAGFHSFDEIARKTGFGDASRMRRAFVRALGQPPQVLRRSFRMDDMSARAELPA